MTVQLSKIKDIVKSNGIKAILQGPTGSGKTASIRTISNPEGVLVIASEKGLLTVKQVCADVAAVEVSTTNELRETFNNVDVGGKWYGMFHTLFLDSFTHSANVLLAEELPKYKNPMQAYGVLNDTIMGMCRHINELSLNVILVCHQMKLQSDTGKILFGAGFPGKQLTNNVPYQFDAVIATLAEQTENGMDYLFQCKQDGLVDAKVRDPYRMLNTYEPADWGKLFNKINGVVEVYPEVEE